MANTQQTTEQQTKQRLQYVIDVLSDYYPQLLNSMSAGVYPLPADITAQEISLAMNQLTHHNGQRI